MGFRARGVYQMIDLDERVNLVVVVWLWGRRCGDSRRKRWMVARVIRERMKKMWEGER